MATGHHQSDGGASDLPQGGQSAIEQLRSAGFSYPDVPVTASCPFHRELGTSGTIASFFLTRGEEFLGYHSTVGRSYRNTKSGAGIASGIVSSGFYSVAIKHNRFKIAKDWIPSTILNAQIVNKIALGQVVVVTNTVVPFCTASDGECLRALKVNAAAFSLQTDEKEVSTFKPKKQIAYRDPRSEEEISDLKSKEIAAVEDLCLKGAVFGCIHADGRISFTNHLDQLSVMAQYDFKKPKGARFIDRQTGHQHSKQNDLLCFDWFCLPGFKLPKHWPDQMVQAIAAIQSRYLKGTYILQSTVILATLVYQWILDQGRRPHGRPLASEPNRRIKHDPELTDPGWITFLAYFPAFLLFHETHRLGAYCHPFDFVQKAYQNDILRDAERFSLPKEQLSIYQDFMSSSGLLEGMKNPVPIVYLTPAMLEGSALSGPYLEQHVDSKQNGTIHKLNVSEIHCHLGWGSVWNMSLPIISFQDEGHQGTDELKARPGFQCYTLPKVWVNQLPPSHLPPGERGDVAKSFLDDIKLGGKCSTVPSTPDTDSIGLEKYAGRVPIIPLGYRPEFESVELNPGWSVHIPCANGIICPASTDGGHRHEMVYGGDSAAADEMAKTAFKAWKTKFSKQADAKCGLTFGKPDGIVLDAGIPVPTIEWPLVEPTITELAVPNFNSAPNQGPSRPQSSNSSPANLAAPPQAVFDENEDLRQQLAISKRQFREKELDYCVVIAKLTQLHRKCSDSGACPSCNLLRTDLAKLVSNQHNLEELAASSKTPTTDEQTPGLLAKAIQLQKDKDDLLRQLKEADTLAQQRKEELDSLDLEAVTAKITQLRKNQTALEERNDAMRMEESKAKLAIRSAQKELSQTKSAIQNYQSCRKLAEALEVARRHKDQARESLAGLLFDEEIEFVMLKGLLESYKEEEKVFGPSDHGGKIGSLWPRGVIKEPSPHPDLDIISSLVICADANSTMRKRKVTEQYEQPQAKCLKTSAEIAESARTVEGWLDKPGQATLSHHTQHLALQSMIAVGAIDPVLTSLGATGIVSLSDEGLKQFVWAQKHKELKTEKNFDELSKRFAGRLQELLKNRGLDKAGHLSTKKLSELAHHSRLSQPGVDEILSQLHQVLVSVQPLRQKLHNTLERISKGGTGDADFISCVKELKESVVPELFSVYTWEPGTISYIEPGLASALRCNSSLGWRRRICGALASLASKYKDLEALKVELELEWRPAYLLSDRELCEISAGPEHTETDPSA